MDDEPEIDESASEPEKPREDAARATPAPKGREAPTPTRDRRSEPVWNSKVFIAGLALIPALATALVTWINKRAEIEMAREEHTHAQVLAAQDQAHKIRMDYFSRAVDPANDAEYRDRVLRFLRRSDADPALRQWADEELEIVAPQAAARRAEEEETRARMHALGRQVRDAQARAETETAEERTRRMRAERELADARAEIADAVRREDCETEYDVCRTACTSGLAVEPILAYHRARVTGAGIPEAPEGWHRSPFACTRVCGDIAISCRHRRSSE